MTQLLDRVTDLFQDYALEKGWTLSDYQLYARVNRAWGKVDVIFVSPRFAGLDPRECYTEIDRDLRRRTNNDIDLLSSIGFVIQTPEQVARGGPHGIPPDYQEVKFPWKKLLKRTVRAVCEGLAQFSRERGWRETDYWIYYSVDEELDTVRFLFVATGFDDADPTQAHQEVMRHLRDREKTQPELLYSVVLRVAGKKQLDEGLVHAPGPEFKEYWTISPR